jgi:hypothetical protein
MQVCYRRDRSVRFPKRWSDNYLFQEISSITEKSQFQKLRTGYRRDTAEDRMMMERYSKKQSKVQKRYSRGQNDNRKVQQKPFQSTEEIQQRAEG